MTYQLSSRTAVACGASKAKLQAALNEGKNVVFVDPAIINPRNGGDFMACAVQFGESFPVVMDPAKRMRFATVTRKADGSFKVT